MGIEENCPTLIRPLENSRWVVTVIDNYMWVEGSVSVDNPNSESVLHHSTMGTLCTHCSVLLARPGCACPRCLSLPKAAMCNYPVLIMTSPLHPLWAHFYMPDGDNWWKVIGQCCCSQKQALYVCYFCLFRDCETAVCSVILHQACVQKRPFSGAFTSYSYLCTLHAIFIKYRIQHEVGTVEVLYNKCNEYNSRFS